jgi:hypothetical protein
MSYLQLAGRRLPPLWLCEAHDLSTNELKSEFLCSWHTGTPLETLVHWVNVSGDSRVVHTVCSHLKKSHSIRTDPRRIMHTPNELRSLWTGLFWHHLFFFCVLLRNNRAIQTHGYFHMQTGMQLKLEEETNVQAMLSTLQCYRRRLGSDKPKYIFIIYFQSTLASLETIQIFCLTHFTFHFDNFPSTSRVTEMWGQSGKSSKSKVKCGKWSKIPASWPCYKVRKHQYSLHEPGHSATFWTPDTSLD